MADSNSTPAREPKVYTFKTMEQLTACIDLSEQRMARAEQALGEQTRRLFSATTLLQGVYALFDAVRHFTWRRARRCRRTR